MNLYPDTWVWITAAQKDELTKMYEYLTSIGLTGKRLALQTDSTDALDIARQLTEHFNFMFDDVHVRAVRHWIDHAVAIEPLHKRMRSVPVSMQMLDDACNQPGLQSVAVSSCDVHVPKAGGIIPSWHAKQLSTLDSDQDRLRSELENQQFWTKALVQIFEQLSAPILEEVKHCLDTERALASIAGRTRANTLRNYVKSWTRFHRWLWQSKQKSVMDSSFDLIDYLHTRADEPCGPSVPLSIVVAVRWILKQSNMPNNWANDRLVINTLDTVRDNLSVQAKLTRRAPRFCAAMIESMEKYSVDPDKPKYLRIVCWVRLLKIWGSLRYDCHTHMRPQELLLASNGISTILRRTKTSGGPRRVSELPVHVGKDSFLCNPDWLHKGFKLLQQLAPFERDYLLPRGSRDLTGVAKQMARYEDASGAGAAVLRDLDKADMSGKLLLPEFATFWTEHSERNLLSSVLVFMDVEKSKRDLVGRWKPEGSDVYMRTYNVVVSKLQHQCAVALTRATRFEDLGEEEVVKDLEAWLVITKGYSHENAAEMADSFRKNINGFPVSVRTMIGAPAISGFGDPDAEFPNSESEDDDINPPQQDGFVIVYEGSKARLHKNAGCWHVRLRKLNKTEFHQVMPEASAFHTICKLCWPEQSLDAVQSASDTDSSGEGDGSSLPITID